MALCLVKGRVEVVRGVVYLELSFAYGCDSYSSNGLAFFRIRRGEVEVQSILSHVFLVWRYLADGYRVFLDEHEVGFPVRDIG